jgi:hypothetical protein
MPLLLLLESLDPLVVVKSLLGGNSLEHVLDSRHHTLKTAEVHVSTVLELGEDLISVFLNLVLDVHLSSALVQRFTGESVVNTEVIRELGLGSLELVIVEEGIRVSNSKEQPSLTLVDLSGRGVLGEKTTDESTEWCDTGTGGNHDVVDGRVLFRHEHNLSGRSGHNDIGTWGAVAQKVRADTLLGWVVSLHLIVPVGGTTDTEGSSLSGHVISVTGRGDGVKTDRVWLAVLLTGSWWDDTPRLTLPVWEVTFVVDDNVASLTSGLRSNDALGGDNLSGERCLVLPDIDRDLGLIKVWLSLKEVLGLDNSAVEEDGENNVNGMFYMARYSPAPLRTLFQRINAAN